MVIKKFDCGETVVILIGVGRIGMGGSELGSELRDFRDGVKGEKEEEI